MNELEDKTLEITQSEQKRENILKNKNEQIIRDLWDYFRRSNICTIRVPGEKKDDMVEKVFKEMIV